MEYLSLSISAGDFQVGVQPVITNIANIINNITTQTLSLSIYPPITKKRVNQIITSMKTICAHTM